MATSDSKEVVIEASLDEIIAVLDDIEAMPEWNSDQESAEILDRTDDGHPHQVKMRVKAAGMADEMVVAYTYSGNVVSSSLVSSGRLKKQESKWTMTPEGDKTRLKFDLTVDPSVPIPGFILKRALKGAMNDNTEGLRKRVLSLKKG